MNWTVAARVTTPVRPMPPAVAQNSSGSSSGVSGPDLAVGGEQVQGPHMAGLKEPALWWFLPWMSAPIAPPTVT